MSVSGIGGGSGRLQQLSLDSEAMEYFLGQARAKREEAKGTDPQTRLAWLTTAAGAVDAVEATHWPAATQTAEAVPASAPAEKADSAQDFLDYARMSIPERIRAKYLEEHGMTEEGLAQLDEKLRKKIEEEIREEIEKAVKGETGKSAGGIANLLV
ncbi:MAG: hypothetical protein ACK4FK_11795 [Ferrovibrio sp.]|jgi:hypothetical protein|uniref:hypothetical protein n=1 Tax=Ferrovibrio sp. TaxID=1917215 RepID=UPI00391D9EF5